MFLCVMCVHVISVHIYMCIMDISVELRSGYPDTQVNQLMFCPGQPGLIHFYIISRILHCITYVNNDI